MLINEEVQEVAQESKGYVNYKGIAPRIILAVNPSNKELGIIYGKAPEGDEPSYVKEVEVGDKMVKRVSIKFYGKTIYSISHPTDELDVILNNTFILEKEFNKSENTGKFQMIDDFGQSCWITKEMYESKKPVDKNGKPIRIDIETWRPAYKGEVNFVNFLRVLFNIHDLQIWSQTAGIFIDNPALKDNKKLAAFWTKEDTEKLLKGDFKELKANVAKVPNNIVINYFYTETSADNRVFTKMLPDVTLKPKFSLNSCIKQFKKQSINQLIAFYEQNNPDKLKGMSLDYVDKLVKAEINPTEYKENDATYVNAEAETPKQPEEVSDLPF